MSEPGPSPSLATEAAGAPRRRLSATYVAVIAVAMVVGAGIFKSPALVAENAGSASG